VRVPSRGRKQNLRLRPPASLRLAFKLASRILYCYYYFFFSRFTVARNPAFLCWRGGGSPPHRGGKPSRPAEPRPPHRPSRGSGWPARRCGTAAWPPTRESCRGYTAFSADLCVHGGTPSCGWVREPRRDELNIKVMERLEKSGNSGAGRPDIRTGGAETLPPRKPRAVRGEAAVPVRGQPPGQSRSPAGGKPAPSRAVG